MSDPLIRTSYFNPLQSNQPSCCSPQPPIQIEDLLKAFLMIQVEGTAGEWNVIGMQPEVRCSEGEDEPNNFVSTRTRKNLKAFIYLNTDQRTPTTIFVPQSPPPPGLRRRRRLRRDGRKATIHGGVALEEEPSAPSRIFTRT